MLFSPQNSWRYRMKILCVHPSGLMYTEIFLRLEPLGLELVAGAIRKAGHDVCLLDLQAETHRHFFRMLDDFHPDVICFSMNYLANIPEVIDLAKSAKEILPETFIFVGGHSASFTASEVLEHAQGAIDCFIRGEGEETSVKLLEAIEHDRKSIA